ncbi:CapA family protein [Halovenus sp. HT40]|uniref:CapA family protein n=1 Tax=Halovenus sp. HT40 TaxID=3126691 RepID=UPI00300EBE1F
MIAAVGDIMTGKSLSWRYRSLPNEETNAYNVATTPNEVLGEEVVETLNQADLAIGNLEAPITDKFYARGFPDAIPPSLTCPPETTELLNQAEIGLVNLANNHMLDHGADCVEETKAALDAAGIEYIGDPLTEETVVTIDQEEPIHCAGFNFTDKGATDSPEEVRAMADRLGEKDGISCLALHWGWGNTHALHPSPDQIELARDITDKGVDVVLGHHSPPFSPLNSTMGD